MMSIQSNMQVHDDLADLFSRNMTFNPELRPEVPKQMPSHEEEMTNDQHFDEPVNYSISQHYHHSTTTGFQRASSEPFNGEPSSSDTLLRIHGIDSRNLTPSQLQLFRIADSPQRRRLVELWSICPPSAASDIPALAWSSTTVEQEEQLARLRYDRQQQTQAMSLDGTMVQTADSTWTNQPSMESEPYMLSGYEELMRRERELQAAKSSCSRDASNHLSYTPATDPVYMGSDYARQLQMAQQYGAFEQSREVDVMDF